MNTPMPKVYDDYISIDQGTENNELKQEKNLAMIASVCKNDSASTSWPKMLLNYEQVLFSTDPVLSKFASEQLAIIGFPSINVLTRALKSDINHVAINAAIAIRTIGPNAKTAIFNLIQMLRTRNRECREIAAATLGILKSIPSASIYALANALKDDELTVRQYASAALGEFTGNDLMYVANELQSAVHDEDENVRSFVKYALSKTHI